VSIKVYDVTCRESFLALNSWIAEIRSYLPDNTPIILLAHKVDRLHERAVEESEGREFSRSNNIIFMEASARTGQNVEEVFDRLIRMCSGQEISTPRRIIYAKRLSKNPSPFHNPSSDYKNHPSEGDISLEISSNKKSQKIPTVVNNIINKYCIRKLIYLLVISLKQQTSTFFH